MAGLLIGCSDGLNLCQIFMFKNIIREYFTRRLYYILILNSHVKKRSRTDIAAQILMAASESVTRTTAMYSAFVDYARLKEYLEILVKNGLLEYDGRLQSYKTTERGLSFLRLYNHPAEYSVKIPL